MIGKATLFAAFAGLVKQASAGECFGDDDFETKFLLEAIALTEEEAAGFTLPEDTCCFGGEQRSALESGATGSGSRAEYAVATAGEL